MIFLLTGDHRWDQMGCAGHPVLRTPAMDRLAREGARFTNAFVTTSLCSPSRATFLTGQYAHAHGVTNNSTELREADLRRTVPHLRRESGYETAYCGKFHRGLSSDPRPGFDYWAVFPGQAEYVNPGRNIDGKMARMEGHSARVSTDLAPGWLRKPRTKPFCLIVGFKEVRTPLTPPPHLEDLYAGARWEAPAFPAEALEGSPAHCARRAAAAARGTAPTRTC
jgi:N-acetylglucosamine-6-sulfatase